MDHDAGLVYLLLALVAVYLIFFSRARRAQRTLAGRQVALEPGLRVMTTSGLHGSVVSVDEENNRIVLEIAPGVHTEWVRQAIAQVIEEPTTTTEDVGPFPPAGTVVDLTGASSGGAPPAQPPAPDASPPGAGHPAPEPGAPDRSS